MKPLILILIPLLVIGSCRKKETNEPVNAPTSARGFKYIPISDVTWKLHLQGHHYDDASGHHFDTGYHFDISVTSADRDTTLSGIVYHLYYSTTNAYHSNQSIQLPNTFVTILLLEDSVTGSVSRIQFAENGHWPSNKFIQYPLNLGDTVYDFRGNGIIAEKDSMVISGITFAYWKMRAFKNGQLYFYQGEGIGCQTGIIEPDVPYCGNGSVLRNITFSYKGDSVRFDFPLSF